MLEFSRHKGDGDLGFLVGDSWRKLGSDLILRSHARIFTRAQCSSLSALINRSSPLPVSLITRRTNPSSLCLPPCFHPLLATRLVSRVSQRFPAASLLTSAYFCERNCNPSRFGDHLSIILQDRTLHEYPRFIITVESFRDLDYLKLFKGLFKGEVDPISREVVSR